MNFKTIFSLVIALFYLLIPQEGFAIASPTFPACTNPQGSVKVTYDSGVHGIVGKTEEHRGRDTVYTLSDETVMQCFCPQTGSGIQTNWWRATVLTGDEIQQFKNQGWYFISNGNLWGLSAEPYLAKNVEYNCNGANNAGGVISAFTSKNLGDVLGLPATGNNLLWLGLLLLLFSYFAKIKLKIKKNH